MVPQAGLEPAPAAYLAQTGYKSAALPIELLGAQWTRRPESNRDIKICNLAPNHSATACVSWQAGGDLNSD